MNKTKLVFVLATSVLLSIGFLPDCIVAQQGEAEQGRQELECTASSSSTCTATNNKNDVNNEDSLSVEIETYPDIPDLKELTEGPDDGKGNQNTCTSPKKCGVGGRVNNGRCDEGEKCCQKRGQNGVFPVERRLAKCIPTKDRCPGPVADPCPNRVIDNEDSSNARQNKNDTANNVNDEDSSSVEIETYPDIPDLKELTEGPDDGKGNQNTCTSPKKCGVGGRVNNGRCDEGEKCCQKRGQNGVFPVDKRFAKCIPTKDRCPGPVADPCLNRVIDNEDSSNARQNKNDTANNVNDEDSSYIEIETYPDIPDLKELSEGPILGAGNDNTCESDKRCGVGNRVNSGRCRFGTICCMERNQENDNVSEDLKRAQCMLLSLCKRMRRPVASPCPLSNDKDSSIAQNDEDSSIGRKFKNLSIKKLVGKLFNQDVYVSSS